MINDDISEKSSIEIENEIMDVAMILKTSARKRNHTPGMCEKEKYKYKYKYKDIVIVDSEHLEKALKGL